MDNIYNSVILSRFLKIKKTDVIGALLKERTLLPRTEIIKYMRK